MTKCAICGTTESKGWMMGGGYTLCRKCCRDISDFELQPNMYLNANMLAEVFFRRGKGEDISYKEIHKEKSGFKFITFKDLFKKFKEKN